jgi:hypothetical protein
MNRTGQSDKYSTVIGIGDSDRELKGDRRTKRGSEVHMRGESTLRGGAGLCVPEHRRKRG